MLKMKGEVLLLTGNYSAAYAAKCSRVQVVAAYPITPQTPCVEKISEFVEKGELKAEFICVESEHSAMSACIGASTCGARTFTATSSQGLALMHEMLHWASGARLPIVLYLANRAFAPPWNIWCDHQDSIAQRDTGWMQFYAEDNQELFDSIIMAYRIAEDREVMLPAMVCADGVTLSHTVMPVEIPDQKDIDDFLPPYDPPYKFYDVDNPIILSHLPMPNVPFSDWYTEFRYLMQEAMGKARGKIRSVCREFKERFGRFHGDFLEEYRCSDADVVVLSMGSIASQMKYVVDLMRDEGYNVGAVKLRVLRPFPLEEIRSLAGRVKGIAVVDRDVSFGYAGAVFTEVKAALYEQVKKPLIKGFIMGLGGRDVQISYQKEVVRNMYEILEKGLDKEYEWIGLRM
jgi:2-oxoisovalerate ferredoxin oxidoreductase alpha subunit